MRIWKNPHYGFETTQIDDMRIMQLDGEHAVRGSASFHDRTDCALRVTGSVNALPVFQIIVVGVLERKSKAFGLMERMTQHMASASRG